MAKSTFANTDAARKIGDRLRGLVTEETISKYDALAKLRLEAGPPEMDAALWLEDIVLDRRAGLVAHLKYLHKVFTGLGAAVERAAAVLKAGDDDNAGVVNALNTWIDGVNDVEIPLIKTNPLPGGRTSYDSNDGGGDPKILWEIKADGGHSGDIIIDVPDGRGGLPNQAVFEEYEHVIWDAGGGRDDAIVMFSEDGHVIKPDDPEDNSGGGGGSRPGEPGPARNSPDGNPAPDGARRGHWVYKSVTNQGGSTGHWEWVED